MNIEEIDLLARRMLGARAEDSHKGDYGYIALVGGSLEYSGAIRLASMANVAMRSGAGVTAIAAPGSICSLIVPQILESTLFPLADNNGEMVFAESDFDRLISRYDCIAVGMGMGNTDETGKAIRYLLENYEGILIIDADGLNALACMEDRVHRLKASEAKIILTPHPGEFGRLRVNDESAEEFAKETQTIVLLKGHTTTVTDGVKTYKITCGCAGMATAGSGDVLSGILSAICASHKNELLAATAVGVYINGVAGEIAQAESSDITMIASDTAKAVKEAVLKIRADKI
ncbi:MAG: NAD(P)H-hydrate dehydratase [Lachnospiraceae bacterium]|nr:NAD(P)H-hydrate dehydratase [Lachnospiraceae bacterium]